MATSAMASDGTLRRSVAEDNSNGVVILNTNTNTNSNDNAASTSSAQTQTATQPTTVIEASPAAESRAEALRKERQNAEVQTEQKIVEKLEDSRLQEEKARAERLFGNKFDNPQPVQPTAPVAPAPVAPAPVVESKPTQVTIEKVEIVQPKEEKKDFLEDKGAAEIKAQAPVKEDEKQASKYYVSGLVGNLNYNANNVKSNYGLGVAVGTLVEERVALELGYFYSNHYIDTFWQQPLYRQLDQNDVSLSAKYYLLTGRLKPYAGASVTYINRTYNERIREGVYWGYNQTTESVNTNAVDMGVMAGLDFQVGERFMIGGGLEYNFNVMNTNEPNWVSNYNLPSDTVELEKINYYVLKVNAKYVF
jgi:hypothetical protein